MAIDATIREAVRRRGRAIPIFFLATSSLAALRGAIMFLAPELELHRLTPGANYLNLVLVYGLAGAGVGVVALAIVTQALGLERADSAELGFAAGSLVGVRAAGRRIAALP